MVEEILDIGLDDAAATSQDNGSKSGVSYMIEAAGADNKWLLLDTKTSPTNRSRGGLVKEWAKENVDILRLFAAEHGRPVRVRGLPERSYNEGFVVAREARRG